jgi:hypothetical protein
MTTTNKALSTLLAASALFFGATGARAAATGSDAAARRGSVLVSGPATKLVAQGPLTIHAYSGFSGGTLYIARAGSRTDADCRASAPRASQAIPADAVISFTVGAGEVACLATTGSRSFELLWHAANAPAPAGGEVQVASAKR